MNAPAKRFSLTRILTAPPPAEPVPAAAPSAPEPPAPRALVPQAVPAPAPAPAPAEASRPPPPRAPQPEPVEKHPKKKRSYSVDMGVCDDLEVLAWYTGRSSSSVVEELVRRYLSQNRAVLEKAREVRRQRP
jgi:hypothetical protein